MRHYTLLTFFFISFSVLGQNLTALQLLEKSIAYHDPDANWPTFNGNFKVIMTTPKQSPRVSDITISLPAEFFSVAATRDNETKVYTVGKNDCVLFYNDEKLNEAQAKAKNMSCARADTLKNYYTYLYGLPMKLKDKGINIHPKVVRKILKNKDYLMLKVSYDAEIGKDIWYFYFNPKTYAMEAYQFYKTDAKGNQKLNSGEYILLSGEETVNGIKMPKIRAWYYNKNDAYLGTDTLGN